MSLRTYIIVNGEKAYEWSKEQHEFICDVCNEPLTENQDWLSLHVRGGVQHKAGERQYQIEWFGLDLHESCVPQVSLVITQKTERFSKRPVPVGKPEDAPE